MSKPEEKHYKGKCPKCGWETTRELEFEEIELVKEGRLRCSGKCVESAVPNAPHTFSPRLILEEVSNGNN